MIEYFVEVSVLYQSHQNYLQLENQYQKAMARIYKSKLKESIALFMQIAYLCCT